MMGMTRSDTKSPSYGMVVNQVELHACILRVKKPDHVAMTGLCVAKGLV
jgi:hypothetical protein